MSEVTEAKIKKMCEDLNPSPVKEMGVNMEKVVEKYKKKILSGEFLQGISTKGSSSIFHIHLIEGKIAIVKEKEGMKFPFLFLI